MTSDTLVSPQATTIAQGLRILAQMAPPAVADLSFFTGKLGHVLLYAYAYKHSGDDAHWQRLTETLDDVLAQLQPSSSARLLTQPGLLPNLAMVLQVLRTDDIADIELGEETLAQFDEVVGKQALAYIRGRNIDFLYGATGALHYLGTRATERPAVEANLRDLLAALLETRVEDEHGIRFFNAHINHLNGNTDINLGLAHGHCGLLLVLLQLHEAGLLQAEIAPLAGRMVDYLLSLELPPEPEKGRVSFFPARHEDGRPLHDPLNRQAYNNRMGWCYGDLNVVQVLHQAARVLGRPELDALACRVGAHTCTRRAEFDSGIDSAHLCHGSASLALYYRQLYAAQPLPCYREAHAYWKQETLDRLPAAYEQGDEAFQASGLLMGLPGMLLWLITEELGEPVAWPQLFLL